MPQSKEERNRKRREKYHSQKEEAVKIFAKAIADQMEPGGVFQGISGFQFGNKPPITKEDLRKIERGD